MSLEILIAFVAACILLGLTPGPNMSLIIANTLRGGLASGFVTLAGTTTGLALLVGAAALGMSSVMVFMAEWFDVIRWLGALYLVFLGARQLWVLAVLFVVVLAAVDVGYTVAIGKGRTTFNAAKLAVLDGAAGVLLLAGGVALAMVRRP